MACMERDASARGERSGDGVDGGGSATEKERIQDEIGFC